MFKSVRNVCAKIALPLILLLLYVRKEEIYLILRNVDVELLTYPNNHIQFLSLEVFRALYHLISSGIWVDYPLTEENRQNCRTKQDDKLYNFIAHRLLLYALIF